MQYKTIQDKTIQVNIRQDKTKTSRQDSITQYDTI